MKSIKPAWDNTKEWLCRGAVIAAAALVVAFILPACLHAQPDIAPDFKVTECFRADSLVLSDYFEFPVVLFFFDALDAACFKAYPYTANWHAKYTADGVQMIGIHCPHYNASKVYRNVITALAQTEMGIPVALDQDLEIYNDFEVDVLPTLMLLEPGGRIVAQASEEADYHDFENTIQEVLKAIEPGVVLPFIFERRKGDSEANSYPPPTPKIDLRYKRGKIVNCDSTGLGEFRQYHDPGGKEPGKIYLEGRWKVEDKLLTYEEGEAAHIRVVYSGKDVWLLPYFDLQEAVRVYVVQDRSPLRPEVMGRDMKNDLEARTFINMRYAVPKHLLSNAAYGTHELKIIPVEGAVSFEYIFFEGAH